MEDTLHDIQRTLLRKLTVNSSLKFNDLLIEDIESEHMNYHLKKLIQAGFVVKKDKMYMLTDLGKEFSNRIDDITNKYELQPKTGILINGVRKNDERAIELLFTRRLKEPYYGKVGRLTGKVRYGELLEEAAKRILQEETSLSANSFVLEKIYHKLRKRENGIIVQDVIFYQFLVKDFYGDFIKKTPFQENFFITKRELEKGNYDIFDDLIIENKLTPNKLSFNEEIGIAEGF
jgi:ADP-ribose pyrophosphatase YjhB (NUDIX family)